MFSFAKGASPPSPAENVTGGLFSFLIDRYQLSVPPYSFFDWVDPPVHVSLFLQMQPIQSSCNSCLIMSGAGADNSTGPWIFLLRFFGELLFVWSPPFFLL